MSASHDPFYDSATAEADRKAGFYQRLVLRSSSFPLSRLFFRLRVTPNQATGLAAGLGVLAAGVAVVGGSKAFVIAAVLLHGAKVMDLVDGNLARAYGRKTWSGKFFDGLSDALQDGLFIVAVGFEIGGLLATFACLAAWISGAGMYARVRFLYIYSCVGTADAKAPHAMEMSRSSVRVGLARRGLEILEQADREVSLLGFLAAALVGRGDLWIILSGLLRILVGLSAFLRATYLGAVVLNIKRRS